MDELKKYNCHKQVHAKQMSRGDYNKLRGWTIPANENPSDAGYLVVYNKGTEDEYLSWSPAHIFDAGYTTHADQTSHVQRMGLEFGSLDGNIERLEAFITTRTFADLDDAEQNRMKRQLVAMREYRDVLKERIDAATGKAA